MSARRIRQGWGRGALGRLRRSERGAALVEYAVTMALFFLLFFAIIDFGRLLYNWVMTEKATQMAVRIAAVRPAVCLGVPDTNLRGSGSTTEDRFGTGCDARDNMCAGESVTVAPCALPDTITCPAASTAGTGGEIWCRIRDLLPPNSKPSNLRFAYSFDRDMNFLGGPYVPVVTVEVTGLTFEFVSPLLGLGNLAAGRDTSGPTTYGNIPFPSMSVSLPGEDLALGVNG